MQPNAATQIGLPLVVVLVLLALARVLGKLLGDSVKLDIGQAGQDKLLAALRGPWMVDEDAEQRLMTELIRSLSSSGRRRAVVIDGIDRMHPRSQQLVLEYAAPGSDWPGGVELWIVLERARTGAMTEELRRQGNTRTVGETRRYYLRLLDRAAKRRLVERVVPGPVGRDDPRLKQIVVTDVRDGRRADFEAAIEEIRQRLGEADIGVARAFGLLALAAAVGDPPRVTADTFENLAQDTDPVSSPAGAALSRWFGKEADEPVAVRGAFAAVATHLGGLLDGEASGSGGLVVDALYADAFTQGRFRKQGIRSLDGGHAFWALYHHEELRRRPSALTADRLRAHVAAIQQPWPLVKDQPLAIGPLREAAEAAAAACLSYSLPEASVPVEKANLMTPRKSDGATRRGAEHVLDLGWAVNALSGERDVLGTIASLRSALDPPVVPDEDRDPLVDLYVQTRLCDQTRVDLDPSRTDPVTDHARARAAWLGMIVTDILPPFGVLGPSRLGPMAGARLDAWTAPAKLAERVLGRLDEPLRRWELTLDLSTLSIALWTSSLASGRMGVDGPPLEAAFERVDQLAAIHLDEDAATDFPIAGLLLELYVVIGVCADVLAAEQPDDALGELAERALAALGDKEKRSPRDRLHRHLDDLHLMWHNLDADELAELSALMRCQLGIVDAVEDDVDDSADFFIGLGRSESREVHALYGCLLRAGAAHNADSRERCAQFLREAAIVGIDAGLGTELVRELCLLALARGHRYRHDMTPLVKTLLWGDESPGRKHETGILELVDSDDLSRFALTLLNGLPTGTDPDLLSEVVASVRRQATDNGDVTEIEQLEHTIALDLLRRRLAHPAHGRRAR